MMFKEIYFAVLFIQAALLQIVARKIKAELFSLSTNIILYDINSFNSLSCYTVIHVNTVAK